MGEGRVVRDVREGGWCCRDWCNGIIMMTMKMKIKTKIIMKIMVMLIGNGGDND